MTESASEADDAGRNRRGPKMSVMLAAALSVCVLALVAAIVMSALWIYASVQSGSDSEKTARDRDAAVEASGDAARALTTVSMDDIEGSLDAMYEVSSGELAEQFAPGEERDELASALEEAGVSMHTDLSSNVLTEFDEDAGTGSALAFIVRNQSLPEGQQRVLRQGIGMSLVRDGDEWTVDDFDTRFAGVGDVDGADSGAPAPGDGDAPGGSVPGGDADSGVLPGSGGAGGDDEDGAGSDEQNPAGS